ncbi:MAG: amylo-alpha-1,6-glucosidase [Mesotoga sp.]|uniref:amylo-alpha-1,6-glucosidase n=1 Tax=Mesotoga sp. TaxID=2053577 RepID=UPI002601D42F|nr:amylo-alpha-1,6-glucosidase [Mesotoga sp.]MDD4825783.1 amylo-alpha-1,6-glucosidase [Mesotoga sp.]
MKVFKNGNLMVVTDDRGIIDCEYEKAAGLYLEDTRFISRMILKSSHTLRRLHTDFSWDRIETHYLGRSKPGIPHYDIAVSECLRAEGNALQAELTVRSYSLEEVRISFEYDIICVFEDIFSVRKKNDSYNELESSRTLSSSPPRSFQYESDLERDTVENSLTSLSLEVRPGHVERVSGKLRLGKYVKKDVVFKKMLSERPVKDIVPIKKTSLLDERELGDLKMLMIPTVYGDFPGAGLPWFATVFGRDSLIFGLQTVDLLPEITRNILTVHTHLQSKEEDSQTEAQPGKIVHETRLNELSLAGRLPFERYYGSIDATLLFIMLSHRYYSQTNDWNFIRSIQNSIMAAAKWVDTYADLDNDGYIEFAPSGTGLSIQSWKDSADSVSFSDGRLAEPPLAPVEVQGYLYDAFKCLEKLMALFEDEERATVYALKAAALKENFNRDFWLESENYFATALDKNKKPVDSITSNPGHCLMTGIVDEDRAEALVNRLFSEELYTGWGIRTLSSKMKRYNPFSYHNGSVWPHDNSLIMLGLIKYGFYEKARQLARDLLKVKDKHHDNRLPELFSGLSVSETSGKLIEYPTSCSPQLWSIGTILVISKALDA